MKKQFQITYVMDGGEIRIANEKDEKTLQEVENLLFQKGSVIIGTTLFMAQWIVKIQRFD